MKRSARQAVLLLLAFGGVSVAGSSLPPSTPREPSRTEPPPAAPIPALGHGERLFRAARDALDDATPVQVPFAYAADSAETPAAAFAFDARKGQILEVTLDAAWPDQGRAIYIEVFRVIDVLGRGLHERLAALRPSERVLRAKLPSDGMYHVLVQPVDPAGEFGLKLELGAALPFPVVGAEGNAIRSLFGASRENGRRHHQGVDIFAQRLTPVLAVAPGRAMPRHDALGGNTVWLNTPGTSYYYAHLDRVAVKESQAVKVGDVLGYVGSSGNAEGMPPHLHFGVYRWGQQPVDPLPLLVGQRFGEEPPAALGAGAGG